jgi:DNA invertase Pin-like site-specific DNA recombinase
MIIGYARVSTDGQTLDAQVAALTAAGANKIFKEKISGARVDRRALTQAIGALPARRHPSRNGALFRSLGNQWADTTTPHGRLMLAVLGGVAEFERELIKSRTSEGRRRATARGIKMGPKFKLTYDQRRFVAEGRAQGLSVRQLARVLGVSKVTIGRIPRSKAPLADDRD